MRKWTGQQLAVIRSSSGRIICSAAAGSGKTAVMIERIIRILQEGADPESFLPASDPAGVPGCGNGSFFCRMRTGQGKKTVRGRVPFRLRTAAEGKGSGLSSLEKMLHPEGYGGDCPVRASFYDVPAGSGNLAGAVL